MVGNGKGWYGLVWAPHHNPQHNPYHNPHHNPHHHPHPKKQNSFIEGGGRVRKIMEFSSFTNDEIYGKGGLKVKFYTVIQKI